MKDIVERALDTAEAQGASYADVRVVRRETEVIAVKNGNVEVMTIGRDEGFGVRVLADGAWGFASSSRIEPAEVDRIAAQAVRIARASATVKKADVNLGPPLNIQATYQTPVRVDPFSISPEQKVALLLECDQQMRGVPGIVVAQGSVESLRERKLFASSEGSYIEQEIVETGCGLEATAADGSEVQNRSYPNSVGRHMGTEGYEFVERYQLPANAERIAREAAQLLTAKPCPSKVTTLILDGTQTALQVHESCGHAVEFDRILGMEAAYAGTSFLSPDMLGHYRYGSDVVTLTADATVPGGLGTFGFDDEGVPAQRTVLVDRGTLRNFITSRETASLLGQASNGTCRADGWNRIPLIRMTNINLERGTDRRYRTIADLIADTDDGILMAVNRSWSIDDRRLNFQFGTEIAWEVKHGQRGALLKNATYTGITPEFWGSCDAVCTDDWVVWGTPNCGKGQPSQVGHVGHGAAPARFRQVRVGVM